MSYASQAGRAKTNARNPQAHAICDRCGFRFNHVSLSWQYDWRGATLQNTKVLVCRHCMDKPQTQLRAIVVPADPTPIINARVQDFVAASTDYQTVTAETVYDTVTGIPIPSTTTLLTEDGLALTTQPLGIPADMDQGAVMPLQDGDTYRVNLEPLSVTATGADQVAVTCRIPHGLSDNDQISVEGLADVRANGFYSVTVTTATAFTYQTNTAIPAGALLTDTTNMITALVGLPYNYTQIPQTGV